MSVSIGIDQGKRMGAALVVDYVWRSIALQADSLPGPLREFLGLIPDRETAIAWIETPDSHVMAARIGYRQTNGGVKLSVFHHTNVNAIFQLGVVSGRVIALCDSFGIAHRFIAAGEVKRLVTGDPTCSKANLALYLEAKGYELPRMPNGKPDPEQVDALAIALAGAKKMEEV